MNTLPVNKQESIDASGISGEMSAWNILSTMGFYPVENGNGIYVLGNHHFPKMAVLTVSSGKTKTWKIFIKNLSYRNIYVSKILLNGYSVDPISLNHYPLLGRNAKLVFEMSDSPFYFKVNEVKLSLIPLNSNQEKLTPIKYASINRKKAILSLVYQLFLVCVTWSLCGSAAFLIYT